MILYHHHYEWMASFKTADEILPCLAAFQGLIHWGQVMHIFVSKLGDHWFRYNGLSPVWYQAMIWTNIGLLSNRPQRTYFNEILLENEAFSIKEMYLKMSFAKCRPFCFSLNALTHYSGLTWAPWCLKSLETQDCLFNSLVWQTTKHQSSA